MKLLKYRDFIARMFEEIACGVELIREPEYEKSVANEIVAYSLSRLFKYNDNVKFGYNNIHDFFKSKDGSMSTTSFDADWRSFQRKENSIRNISDNFAKYKEENGFETARSSYMPNNRIGRMYDRANLEFIYISQLSDKKFDLYDYILKNRICDSHKVSNKQFNDAYLAYNEIYQKAKDTEDKEEYIFKWINLYRAERALHLSLIPKIVDFIVDKKDLDFIFPHLSEVWGTRFFEDKYVSSLYSGPRHEKYICEPFQVLRYSKYIKPLFSSKDEEELDEIMYYIAKERILENIIAIFSENRFDKLFSSLRTGEENAIVDAYDFCKEHYQIIESYSPVDFCMKDDKSKLDNKRIKCARKVIQYLLKPDELNKIIREK